jgi:hypothetical protein
VNALLASAQADDPAREDNETAKNLKAANQTLGKLARTDASNPEIWFVLAGIRSLAADLGVRLEGADSKDSGLSDLERAVRDGYRGTHPDDLKTSRTFRTARENERRRFEAAIRTMADALAEHP